MDAYLARQPIFNKYKKVYGYELLYRDSEVNCYSCEDGDKASGSVMINSFHVMGIDTVTSGKKAFVNFTDNLLKEGMATLFPNEYLVVEILETVQPCAAVIESCKELKNKGYVIALDDFVISSEYISLIELADIIKVDFLATPPHVLQAIVSSLNKYKIRFLAEKIETHEAFENAKNWGYTLFQGYFFSKPVIMSVQDVSPLKLNYLRLIQMVNAAEFEFEEVADIVSKDLSLSYSLLRMMNSAAFGFRTRIHSVRQALVLLGSNEIRKWISLIAIKGIGKSAPEEIITTSLVRARFLEQLSVIFHNPLYHEHCFLTGLFSTLDVLINRPMDEILKEIAIDNDIIEALIDKGGATGMAYELILAYEKADWDRVSDLCELFGFDKSVVTDIYIEAVTWSYKLECDIHA